MRESEEARCSGGADGGKERKREGEREIKSDGGGEEVNVWAVVRWGRVFSAARTHSFKDCLSFCLLSLSLSLSRPLSSLSVSVSLSLCQFTLLSTLRRREKRKRLLTAR